MSHQEPVMPMVTCLASTSRLFGISIVSAIAIQLLNRYLHPIGSRNVGTQELRADQDHFVENRVALDNFGPCSHGHRGKIGVIRTTTTKPETVDQTFSRARALDTTRQHVDLYGHGSIFYM